MSMTVHVQVLSEQRNHRLGSGLRVVMNQTQGPK